MEFDRSRVSHNPVVGFLCVLCAIASWSVVLCGEPDDHSDRKDAHAWISQANSLIEKLDAIILARPDTPDRFFEPNNRVRRAEGVLWDLWLTTGMPPVSQDHKPFNIYLSENTTAYREYVSRHKDLNLEQLHRLGIDNTKSAFGSPLWYMATKYLVERGRVTSDYHFESRPMPARVFEEIPLKKEAYIRQTTAVEKWLKENGHEMVWNKQAKRFHPRNGKYVGTDELFQSLAHPGDIIPGE